MEQVSTAANKDDQVDSLVRSMKTLAVGGERESFNYLVKAWVTSEEREYQHSQQLQELNAELTLGKQPVSDQDWHEVLLKIYGESVLQQLTMDAAEVQKGIDGCLAETKSKPRHCAIYDWLQRSEAGFLKYPPMVNWVETNLDTMLHKQLLESQVALGVGVRYAAILAKRKALWGIYYADLAQEDAFYANNVSYKSVEQALGKVSINKLKEQKVIGEICAYSRSACTFSVPPDSGFVSGEHVVLCWPQFNTGNGFVDRFQVFRMPMCLPEGDTHHTFDAPVSAVNQLSMLYPYLAFSTSTSLFAAIPFIREAGNFSSVFKQLNALKEGSAKSARKDVELVVTFDIEQDLIHRVIPVEDGMISNISLHPRMTSPTDALIPPWQWKISWNVLNESQPSVHGKTFTDFLLARSEERQQSQEDTFVVGFYWNKPEVELAEAELNTGSVYKTSCVEACRATYRYPGGHVVQISEHNLSTIVAKNEPLFPENKSYHAREYGVVDCAIYGGLHILVTPAGQIQFSQLRLAGNAPLLPIFTIGDADLAKVCGRVMPEGAQLCKDTEASSIGQYKAIWIHPSFRVVVQLCNGVLIVMRPRTFEELRSYLERAAASEAEKIAARTSRIVAERQLREAHAMGVEPAGVALAKKEALTAQPKERMMEI